jgi:hypothetical protein
MLLLLPAPCCCCWSSSAAARQSMWKVVLQLLQLSMKRSMARLQQPQRLEAALTACSACEPTSEHAQDMMDG